jgi:hypothetical protein
VFGIGRGIDLVFGAAQGVVRSHDPISEGSDGVFVAATGRSLTAAIE